MYVYIYIQGHPGVDCMIFARTMIYSFHTQYSIYFRMVVATVSHTSDMP